MLVVKPKEVRPLWRP